MTHITGCYNEINNNLANLRTLTSGNEFFKTKGYEASFANAINFSEEKTTGNKRYWDCIDSTKQLKIELKKTQSNKFYLDLIRYYEILLAINGNYDNLLNYPEQARVDTTTAFICTKNNGGRGPRIVKIYIVDSKDLLAILKKERDSNFTDDDLLEEAKKAVSWYNNLLRGGNRINSQFHLNVRDIEAMPSVKKIVLSE